MSLVKKRSHLVKKMEAQLARHARLYGLSISKKRKRKYEEKMIYKLRDENENQCMAFSMDKHSVMHIESMKYTPVEYDCSVPGSTLMAWITSLVPGIVARVDLEDDSYLTLVSRPAASSSDLVLHSKRIEVPLMPFRYFFQGQGWYHKYGFRGTEKEERILKVQMERLKGMPISVFRSFLSAIVAPFVDEDGSVRMPRGKSWTEDYSESVSGFMGDVSSESIRMWIVGEREDHILHCVRIIAELSEREYAGRGKTVKHILSPAGSRTLFERGISEVGDVSKDVVDYVDMVMTLIGILKEFDLLRFPIRLTYT